ncbi:MAG: hypothetical protein ACREJY_16045 [Candidatus Rokuibacteriota bacterium]
MASPERKISVVPPPGTEPPAGVEARLASLEGEAERLRAEVAALQDEIRWLTDEEAEWSGDPAFISHGLLARGWVRASLLLAAVGFVALVSVPYLFHLLDASGRPGDPAPVAAASSIATTEPVAPAALAAPAATQVPPPERVPAPVRVRAFEIPDPARVLTAGRGAAAGEPSGYKNAARSDHGTAGASDAGPSSAAPVRDESP